jgi:ABC-type polysaccharide/polyol phosphate export permease
VSGSIDAAAPPSRILYDSARRTSRAASEARALWRYRGLVIELVIRDIKVRYKRSVLGVLWTLLAPLINMVTLTIVFSAILRTAIENYPAYFLTGYIFWTFFAQATSSVALQTQDANEMAKRIFVPRSVFVAAAIGVALVNLTLSLLPLVGILAVTGSPLYAAWAFTPVAVLLGILFTSGVAFFLFILASRFTDVREMYLVLIQTWFFLTPIVYHASIVPARYRLPIWINPMHYLIQTFRRPIYEGVLPGAWTLVVSAGCALGVFVLGWLYFCRKADELAIRA